MAVEKRRQRGVVGQNDQIEGGCCLLHGCHCTLHVASVRGTPSRRQFAADWVDHGLLLERLWIVERTEVLQWP
jgi:hypothetical protein